jgi:glyoxylase-like metal-dependent hydrolase (beta-lactamase superfamily II)/rhodanese-related sulfurtransferase
VASVDVNTFIDEGLGNSSYLVDLGDGRALVVDPARDPRPYLTAAASRRLRIAYAAETHLHADFLSGARELAAARDTRLLGARAAGYRFPHLGLADGEELRLGGLTLRALATPGHAPEHLAWLLLDDGRPAALFSGGALLVGGVARTDLVAPEQTRPLAHAAWHSLRNLLDALPDDLPVFPTHGAGSFCAAPGQDRRTTTIGAERAANRLLATPDPVTFADQLLGGLGTYPPYFLRLREVNRRGPELLGPDWATLPRLPIAKARAHLAEGALLIDARPIAAFAAGHPIGAVSNALRPQFATWLGWLAGERTPLVFLLEPGQDPGEVVRQCRTIGYDRLLGEIAGGMPAWRAAGLPEATVELLDPDRAGHTDQIARAGADPDVLLLDVRQASEVATGHIPGAVAIELGALDSEGQRLPPGPITTMCGHGERAMTAASLLARQGHTGLRVLLGGARSWHDVTGRPLVGA